MKLFLLFLFVGASTSIHITCNFHYSTWVVVGSGYTCDVTEMDFTDNSTHITSYDGQHLAGNSSDDVKFISFPSSFCSTSNLKTIPKGFSNIFPNIEGFSYVQCPINFLNGDELDEHPNLKLFGIFNTNLTRVPGNFFASTQNIQLVAFESNKIESVGYNLLNGLDSLVKAWFGENICINQRALDPSELPALIVALRVKCPDIAKCEIGDLEDFVCGLEEEIDVLREENQNLRNKVENLEASNESVRAEVEILNSHVGELKAENEEIRAILNELENIILDLTSRPCTC